ncbi:hypothetical protein [Chitinivibrio alkaliphilus]|uniref:Lipoprotein n=1 Tax=Chitinivibrio alkaliphilus ACht1 TaxID=1313304 RepID=U7DCG5_9BACT|nr:hypothetical protein [Chitinivibrio alkaliphilus]ERP32120.1 hypothetical protein CALK_0843 [Chitinivibrio alkaliphilus ACht1]
MKRILSILLLFMAWGCGASVDPPEEEVLSLFLHDISSVPSLYSYQYDDSLQHLSDEAVWEWYRHVRFTAIDYHEQGEHALAAAFRLKAAEAMVHLHRVDIAAWQFNNAGKHLLDLFEDAKSQHSDVSMDELRDTYGIFLTLANLYFTTAHEFTYSAPDRERSRVIAANRAYLKNMGVEQRKDSL